MTQSKIGKKTRTQKQDKMEKRVGEQRAKGNTTQLIQNKTKQNNRMPVADPQRNGVGG